MSEESLTSPPIQ